MTPARRTFGSNAFGAAAGPHSLGVPAAVYPGAVASDSDLIVAVDRQQTRLALPLNSTDTSMTVLDPSSIVPYCLLTIDAETVKVTGPPVGNVVPVSRAFDGTLAAQHLASAVVSGFVDAYHHNRLAAEIKAIESTLGANLSKIPAAQVITNTAYNFTPQTPGGSLTVGANTIAMNPLPTGVNASSVSTPSYLYISGGTGLAEAAKIIGVSGSNVTVQCANTHTGAWTISSATAGLQEALNFLGHSGGVVYIPPAAIPYVFYATATVPDGADWQIYGGGAGFWSTISTSPISTIRAYFANSPLIQANGAAENARLLWLHDFTLVGAAIGDGVATGDGINLTNALRAWIDQVEVINFDGNGIVFNNCYESVIERAYVVDNGRSGILLQGTLATSCTLRDCRISTNVRFGGGVGSNVLVTATCLSLNIVQCIMEDAGQHPWVPPITAAENLTIAGGATAAVNVEGCYFENPAGGANGANVSFQSPVTSFRFVGNYLINGHVLIVTDAPVGEITNNMFANNNSAYSAKAIWTPYDSGGRHELTTFPNSYIATGNIFGSALMSTLGNGWWLAGAGTAGAGTHPTAGSWQRGDKVYDPAPSSGGFLGVICVTAGSPGTWKNFGAIS